jgi:hypothetical protein
MIPCHLKTCDRIRVLQGGRHASPQHALGHRWAPLLPRQARKRRARQTLAAG